MDGEHASPRPKTGIGAGLEKARQEKGLSLQQVEQETKIRSRYLRDLERENFDVLPAVYVLGSLKTYADFLGLDGAALSRELRARSGTAGPEGSDEAAADGNPQTVDDEYEAAPVVAAGFNQLFLGMGVVLISILAIMTLVFAVAEDDAEPISQMDAPSTDEAPSEIALAGNTEPEPRSGDAPATGDERNADQNAKRNQDDEPETPKDEEDKKNRDGRERREAPSPASTFDGVKSVPIPPSSASAASASPSPAPVAVDDRTPDPSPTAPVTKDSAPATATAPPEAASPGPVEAPATEPSDGDAGVVPVRPATPAASGADGSLEPVVGAGQAPSPTSAADPGRISAEVDRRVGEALGGLRR